MSNKKVRNAEIDFLRLIFSIAVVFYHCTTFLTPNGGPEIFPRGAIAVEFFFILSGFLMARSAQKVGPNPDVGRETCKYIVSRYRMLWLYMIPAAILLVAELISSSGSLRTAPRYAAQGFAELLCLSQSGLFSQDVNAPAWYLSALILCSWLLFPLLIWKPSAFKKIVAPLISVFLLGYLQQAYHGIGKATQPVKINGLRCMRELHTYTILNFV